MRKLVRRYIGGRLFEYYSQPANKVVGRASSAETARLSSSLGEWHWRRLLQRYYDEREGHWLTPVEVFQPHFSRVLGDFSCGVVEMARKNASTPTTGSTEAHSTLWEIVELGGGRGTNAKLLLSYFREYKPELYQQLKYTLVDSSPSLYRLQQEVLKNSEHADHVEFHLIDLMDVADKSTSLLAPSDTPTVVLAMEVLDNLPHDKVRTGSRKQLQQAEIYKHGNGIEEELFMPLDDPLLTRIIQTVPSYVNHKHPTWIPSVACGIIEHVIRQRPNLGLAFADFDWLPAPDLIETGNSRRTTWGHGEPIITDMEGVDYECYLHAPPHCDVLFPTNFDKLGSFAKRSMESMKRAGHVQVEKQADFLQRYGSAHVQQTKSWLTGHTPLLHDFINCSVLTITPAHS